MRYGLWVAGFCSALFVARAPVQAQRIAVVQGVVVDTLGAPLSRAEIVAIIPRSRSNVPDSGKVIATVTADAKGHFTFRNLKRDEEYFLLARKIGYGAASSPRLKFVADTTEIRFELEAAALNTVYITAKLPAAYQVTAAQIEKMSARDALDVVMRYRRRMMGDAYKGCVPDTSRLTVDESRYYPPGPRYMGNPKNSPNQFRIFVNGIQQRVMGAKNVLALIPSKDILEIRYVSCWDMVTPKYRNSLMVILKEGARF